MCCCGNGKHVIDAIDMILTPTQSHYGKTHTERSPGIAQLLLSPGICNTLITVHILYFREKKREEESKNKTQDVERKNVEQIKAQFTTIPSVSTNLEELTSTASNMLGMMYSQALFFSPCTSLQWQGLHTARYLSSPTLIIRYMLPHRVILHRIHGSHNYALVKVLMYAVVLFTISTNNTRLSFMTIGYIFALMEPLLGSL